jgi:cAMP phosphodiesterase
MLTLRLLPSSFASDGSASDRQHYSTYVVNGCVAVDAGSLASAVTDKERSTIRDVILTHAHLDHVAGLPLFIDDLFPLLRDPVRVHATREVIEILEAHIFNWKVYPRFAELRNEFGPVIKYCPIPDELRFDVQGLQVRAIPVNHKVPASGFLIQSGPAKVVLTGDTAEMAGFWDVVNDSGRVDALLIECAFPNGFEDLAVISHHLTPRKLESELKKIDVEVGAIYVINMKPAYRNTIVNELNSINDSRINILEVGREYRFG